MILVLYVSVQEPMVTKNIKQSILDTGTRYKVSSTYKKNVMLFQVSEKSDQFPFTWHYSFNVF